MQIISNIIRWFSNLSSLYPIVTGWKIKGLLWYYAWICLLSDVASLVIKYQHWPRYIHANLFLVAEFMLVSLYLIDVVLAPALKWVGRYIIALLAILFIIHTALQLPLQTNYVDGAIFYGIYIFLCIAALHRVMIQQENLRLDQSEVFIFSAAFLLYASGCMTMLLFKITLNKTDKDLINRIWDIHNVLNILKNFAIGYLFIVQKRKAILGRQ